MNFQILLKRSIFLTLLVLALTGCDPRSEDSGQGSVKDSFKAVLKDDEGIAGKENYLGSPYVTAGNRVYMVGHQDGSFPDLGWHIKGEMGGIWNHPIKLMDGFDVKLSVDDSSYELNKAHSFVNYPFANLHRYSWPEMEVEVERIQFVPDNRQGICFQFVVTNASSSEIDLGFEFTGHADLRPTWLGEETGMIDEVDQSVYDTKRGAWVVKDSLNPWYAIYGSPTVPTDKGFSGETSTGQGVSNTLNYVLKLGPGQTKRIDLVIAGSYESKAEAMQEYEVLNKDALSLLEEKRNRYKELERRSRLTIPDKEMQQAFEWLKYNSDWLVRTVPGVGTGITAGLPDYPWWFGVDSEYALKGYMAIGQDEVTYSTIRLLDSISEAVNGNGRIVHEVSTNGYVFNKGNINETPQFASLIWEVYRWNGDREFLERYFPTIQKGLNWLMTEKDTDGNLFPEGFGMMEIHGLDSEMIDVAAYTQRAFADASKIARAIQKDDLAEKYEQTAVRIADKINTEFWSDEFSSYADFIGTDSQALHLIDDAIVRADTLDKPWAVEELKATRELIKSNPSPRPKPFVVHHNWVVNTPMEMQIAPPEKALSALVTAEQFVNPFGVFVTGIDRDESAGSDDGSFKGSKVFSYTGAVMTLPTGVQVVAENNYGRSSKALNYLQRMTRTFSYALPGSMYEVSPDYGMMAQAWNIYAFAVPIVQQFFGVQPNAAEKEIVISPHMPYEWSEASLEHVVVGDNEISVYFSRTEDYDEFRIEQVNEDWSLRFEAPISDKMINSDGPQPVYELISSSPGQIVGRIHRVKPGN